MFSTSINCLVNKLLEFCEMSIYCKTLNKNTLYNAYLTKKRAKLACLRTC